MLKCSYEIAQKGRKTTKPDNAEDSGAILQTVKITKHWVTSEKTRTDSFCIS